MSKSIRVNYLDAQYISKLTDVKVPEVTSGQVKVKTLYSSINYKDALAVTGRGKIIRNFPLTPGIDFCGEVIESKSKKFKIGDTVFQTGGNLGELYDGGLSEHIVVNDKNCLLLPRGLTPQEVMTLGTAGFTAALAIYKMELNTLKKEHPVLVTGSTGGVGNFAVQILSQKKYSVTAMTAKSDAHDWLNSLGATVIISPQDINLQSKPLETIKWSGCVDNVGGELLQNIIPHIDLYGHIASVGLAGGFKLNTTVMPFILRGVNILGVSSNNCPMNIRKQLWDDLSSLSKPKFIEASHIINLNEVHEYSTKLLDRKIQGRIIVKF